METGPEAEFRRLYAAHFDAVLAYSLRRCDSPEDAADVTIETFLVAWRRFDQVPTEPDALLWLYGVARRVQANLHRSNHRRSALGARLRTELAHAVPDVSDGVVAHVDVVAALRTLPERDREVLELHLWEGLRSGEIAEVLGLSVVVVRPRLSRARARLRAALDHVPGNGRAGPAHLPTRQPHPAWKE